MPTYDWLCEKCSLEFETTESIKEYSGKAPCVFCGQIAQRIYSRCTFHHTGAKIESAEFNPGLGRVTKSKAHRAELAKQLGAVEVGNDFHEPDSVHKHFDTSREERLKKSWDDV